MIHAFVGMGGTLIGSVTLAAITHPTMVAHPRVPFPPVMLVSQGRPNIAVCGVPGCVTVGRGRGGALVCGTNYAIR